MFSEGFRKGFDNGFEVLDIYDRRSFFSPEFPSEKFAMSKIRRSRAICGTVIGYFGGSESSDEIIKTFGFVTDYESG